MAMICDRKNQRIRKPTEINDEEVYIRLDTSDKQFLRTITDPSSPKRASDHWDHKRKLSENIETYADHFEYKIPGLQIERTFEMVSMQPFKKPRINYLKNSPSDMDAEQRSISIISKPEYFPVEVLRYAPLNQRDFELIYKLPNVLVRIGQLTVIEQLRELFVQKFCSSLQLVNNKPMPTVTFKDCLPDLFASVSLNMIKIHLDNRRI